MGRSCLKRLLAREDGVAAVEFAIAVPIMVLLYLGSVEGSTLIIVDRKVQTAASALGDLVARTDGTLRNGELENYFHAASAIMNPYDAAPMIPTVSGVSVLDGKAVIEWSRQYRDGKLYLSGGPAVGTPVELPKELTAMGERMSVILAEAQYRHSPSFGVVFEQKIDLKRTSYHVPRTSKGVSLEN